MSNKKLCIKINHRETTKSLQFMKNTETPMKPRNKCIHIGVQSLLQQKNSLQIRQFRKYRSQEKSFNELPTFFQVKRQTGLKFPILHRGRRAQRLKSLDGKRAQQEIRANAPNLQSAPLENGSSNQNPNTNLWIAEVKNAAGRLKTGKTMTLDGISIEA